ncbi:MAG: adenylate/guanylate cyclase domain-containing protein [Candidatus Dormiibacterota bacterium]
MSRCPACGHENQAQAKFCSECGAVMTESAARPREERKVVTVLFADLVGFTSRSERLDPEDVRALLSPYYTKLRTELERFGGTVEKFIGDAVMALFGAPVAHEDDPERAVRAALAIRDWVQEQEADLQLRIAVNTGEALVSLGAQPTHGEGMASGDVVNTTARLQTAAPVNGILVGETTYRATSNSISYREAMPVAAKGKTEPVKAWEVVEARSRMGVDLFAANRSPLVGRLQESLVLTEALARVQRERSPQLVTLVGVPGIGKSRLVAELFQRVDADPETFVIWRQGRSLPYGDGVTFWALAEMVKAQAGILETHTEAEAEQRLDAAVAALIADPADAKWISGHLRPLAGVSTGADVTGDRREEAFTAWRRFFEALAEQNPLVLVFEDLHWADDNLLDFVEHLVDWAGGVPMLVVCSTRPELLERRPGWAGTTRNAIRLSLAPLTDDETSRLISSLSERPVMAAEAHQALLLRAGGNPLYAEQYVRMLAERGDAEDLPLPETVQGIIAARLDALTSDEKRLLQDASVLGKVFWLGAVAVGLDRRTAELRLHALERKDFVQRARRSSVAGEAEYAFLHVLVRDVAYGQIPRGERAEKHRLAAAWIGSLGRTEDHAEMLAHHYMSALELDRATGGKVDASFAARALDSVRDAGDRAYSLNAWSKASSFYASALDLAAPDSHDRARLLFVLGRSRYQAGEQDEEMLTAASAALVECGDSATAAEAEVLLTEAIWVKGDASRAFAHLTRARELVEAGETTRVKAHVTSTVSRYLMLAGEDEEAIRIGRSALEMADFLGLDEVRVHALNNIGAARGNHGDLGGIADLELAVSIAEQNELALEGSRSRSNLASVLWTNGNLERTMVVVAEAVVIATRYGLSRFVTWLQASMGHSCYALGDWDAAHTSAEHFLADVEAGSPHYLAADGYMIRAEIRLGRDDAPGALRDAEQSLALARLAKDRQILYPALAAAGQIFLECGDAERAGALADELLENLRTPGSSLVYADALHALAWTLIKLGRGEDLLACTVQSDIPWVLAARAFASGDFGAAAGIHASMGAVTDEARDRLVLAESLIGRGRRAEADIELQRALAFYRSVGATRYIRQGEALFAASA